MKKIVWKDLPKSKGMFTKRNAEMVSLEDMKTVQYYAANTKIQLCQCTFVYGKIFFRTETAVSKELNWGFPASAFDIPKDEMASLVLLCTDEKVSVEKVSHTPSKTNRNVTREPAPKSEVGQAHKKKLFNRFFNRFKKGK